jgi:S-adenosylmethionine:tRNA-ribosyltransferase-isomerase (queuine synthetase)
MQDLFKQAKQMEKEQIDNFIDFINERHFNQFRISKALITNFHQPQSTLLLLISAIMGDEWKKVYSFALKNDFRFLSFGDGSLLFIKQ